jgi:hypothetical protein
MRIKHNDLTHYFLRPHQELPQGYLDHCKKFFDGLKLKQDSSRKLQASSRKLDKIK